MRNQRLTAVIATLILGVVFGGCAELETPPASKPRPRPNPRGAELMIYDKTGQITSANQSPVVVPTMRTMHPFRAEDYWIVIKKKGFKSAEIHVAPAVNGWSIGPIHLAGPIGLLILDQVTGAAYALPPEAIEQKLAPTQRAAVDQHRAIAVILLEHATPAERMRMKFVVGSA